MYRTKYSTVQSTVRGQFSRYGIYKDRLDMMEYDLAALELVKMCASARLSEAERAVLTLLLLLEGGRR